ISLACLAVVTRGSLAKVSRTHQERAYQKLTGLEYRWRMAEKVWGPIVEIVVQGLVIPVVLFLVGLIDNLMSTSLPFSHSTVPVFVGGVISCVCCVVVGTYIVYTMLRGSLDGPGSFSNSWLLSCYLDSLKSTKVLTVHPWIQQFL
ncbi:hypothetical protein H0H87_001800, partial [Tephrocybe sp. NHM501043]